MAAWVSGSVKAEMALHAPFLSYVHACTLYTADARPMPHFVLAVPELTLKLANANKPL